MLTSEVLFALAAIVVVFAAVEALWLNPFRRIKRPKEAPGVAEADGDLPKLTVLVDAIDNTDGLEQHLSAILTQCYEPGFEVVVVTEHNNPAAEAIVKHYAEGSWIRSTFIPTDTLFLSRHKLAVTLGVKAALNEWILLVDAACEPLSDEWLTAMASRLTDGRRLVLGYANYEAQTQSRRRLLQFRDSMRAIRRANRHSAYCSCGSNVLFSRTDFLSEQPYRSNLQLEYGECDFLVNCLSTDENTTVCTDADGKVAIDKPTEPMWRHEQLVGVNVRHHLSHFFVETAQRIIGHAAALLSLLLVLAALAFGLVLEQWPLIAAVAVALLVRLTIKLLVVRSSIRQLSETISVWKSVLFYEPTLLFHDLRQSFRYLRSDKLKFNTHKP